MDGSIHSIQSLGTLDGPGIRFVTFLQGCPLRCSCCHNPDTWTKEGGKNISAEDLVQQALRYQSYFGKDGGITLSGGEPLLQAEFAHEVFRLCHAYGISTCLDTSGCMYNEAVDRLLDETDHVLLDIKYTTDEDYRAYVGCSLAPVLQFLEHLEERKLPTTVRQVIIPTKNATKENVQRLCNMLAPYTTVRGIELLPFHKMCAEKYKKLERPFPFGDLPEPTEEEMETLRALLPQNKK